MPLLEYSLVTWACFSFLYVFGVIVDLNEARLYDAYVGRVSGSFGGV